MVLLGNVCLVEACFSPFGDSVSLGTRYVHSAGRTIGSQIILDASDDTPR
jgi:hypothetical protein